MAVFAAIASFVSSLFAPAQAIISKVVTSDHERLELANELATIQSKVQDRLIELQEKALEADVKIREAELNSSSWLSSNWRPITVLTCFVLIVLSSFNLCKLDPKILDIFQYLIGGYAGGRTIEKVTASISDAINKNK